MDGSGDDSTLLPAAAARRRRVPPTVERIGDPSYDWTVKS